MTSTGPQTLEEDIEALFDLENMSNTRSHAEMNHSEEQQTPPTRQPEPQDPLCSMFALMQSMEKAREEQRREEAKQRAAIEEAREERFQHLLSSLLTSQQQEREEVRKAEAERRLTEDQMRAEWAEQQRRDQDALWKRDKAIRDEDLEREKRRDKRQMELLEQQRKQKELDQKRRDTPKLMKMSEDN